MLNAEHWGQKGAVAPEEERAGTVDCFPKMAAIICPYNTGSWVVVPPSPPPNLTPGFTFTKGTIENVMQGELKNADILKLALSCYLLES